MVPNTSPLSTDPPTWICAGGWGCAGGFPFGAQFVSPILLTVTSLQHEVQFKPKMVIGPYDKRLKRSRCLNCIARHNKARNVWPADKIDFGLTIVQCSGDTPCSSCQKSSLVCRYASWTSPIIRLDNRRPLLHSAIVPPKTPAVDQQSTFFQHFFLNFLPRNSFSSGDSEWTTFAVSQLSQCRGHHSALLSLGALVSHSHQRRSRHGACVLAQAIQSYQDSVRCLQVWIDRGQNSWDPLRMLSLAFLLSLFEACSVDYDALVAIY
jgi:hypothetical protein